MEGGRRSSSNVKVGVLVAATVLAAGACRQIAGIDERREVDSCGATAEPDRACGECLGLECCGPLAACAADADCARAQACLAACAANDEKCRAACTVSAAIGFDALLADLLVCRNTACANACPSSCGSGAVPSNVCATCVAEGCCAEERACNASASCLVRRFRRARCTEETCRTQVERQLPSGASEDHALATCRLAHCETECAAWQCVGASSDAAGPMVVTLLFGDSLKSDAVPGLRVRRCNAGDADCSPTTPDVTTNGSGVARFEIATRSGTFDGYFEVIDPAGDRAPTLVFPYPAIRGARTIPVPSLTRESVLTISTALGAPSDPALGTVVAHAHDCTSSEGAGVQLALAPEQPEATPFYLDHGLFTVASQTATTDGELAYGGFLGVAPRSTTLKASWRATKEPLFAAAIYMRPGTISFVDFAARP